MIGLIKTQEGTKSYEFVNKAFLNVAVYYDVSPHIYNHHSPDSYTCCHHLAQMFGILYLSLLRFSHDKKSKSHSAFVPFLKKTCRFLASFNMRVQLS